MRRLRGEKRHPLKTRGARKVLHPSLIQAKTLPLLRRLLVPQGSFNEGLFSERLGLSRRRTILPLGRLPVRWLLSLLQLLLLLLVFLLQLLRLLLVPLLHLLLCPSLAFCFASFVLLVLLLLEFVSFQLLLRDLLFLLLLVLLVPLRVARIWSAGPCQGRKVVRMDGRAGSTSVVL